MDIHSLLEGFLTWQTPLSFMAGVGTHHLYCKYWREREGPPRMLKRNSDGTYALGARLWAIAAIVALIVGFIGWRTQDTADRVDNQATQTRDCLTQVIIALNVARTISVENDELSVEQRTAYAIVLEALVAPPEPYYSMSMDDPRRAEYLTEIGLEQLKLVKEAQDSEGELNEKRAAHPYPDPDCAILQD